MNNRKTILSFLVLCASVLQLSAANITATGSASGSLPEMTAPPTQPVIDGERIVALATREGEDPETIRQAVAADVRMAFPDASDISVVIVRVNRARTRPEMDLQVAFAIRDTADMLSRLASVDLRYSESFPQQMLTIAPVEELPQADDEVMADLCKQAVLDATEQARILMEGVGLKSVGIRGIEVILMDRGQGGSVRLAVTFQAQEAVR